MPIKSSQTLGIAHCILNENCSPRLAKVVRENCSPRLAEVV